MVKEYIQQKKKNTEIQIAEKKKELKKVQEMEKIICGNIERIQQSDIDFEIFSPRTGEISLRGKKKELEQELGKIRVEMVNIEEEIGRFEKKREDFEEMLREIEKMSAKVEQEDK